MSILGRFDAYCQDDTGDPDRTSIGLLECLT
jgi:hypothetical protein